MKIKEDWLINNQNIFGFQQGIDLSLSSIQYEISNQLNEKNINSIADYLGSEIDINKEIRLTKSLTIKSIFDEYLGFENIDPLEQKTVNCYLILSYLQLSLLKEYCENKHNGILTFSDYEKQYNTFLNSFLNSNIDTDEQDFIKTELILCNNLIAELNKPVYNVISPLNEVLDKPCEFKKNLLNSIDKRQKHLKAIHENMIVESSNKNDSENEDENNDFIKSTIEDYLEPIKEYFNTKDFDLLVSELDSYFKTGAFTNSIEIIKTVNRPNKKLIGWQLKELYNNCINDNTKLSIEYLRFGKQRISIFKDVSFDESNYLKSNLYKYYNTKVTNT